MLLGMPAQMLAQTDDTEEKKEDVITVTDKQGNEEEIEVPVGLEDNLDSLLHLYNAKTYMMQDTSCNYRDVNPVFDKEVYIDRLKRLPTIIEMPYNEVVQKFIDGLEVNSLIDERRDPVKASYAAAHYLSDLYKIFDDWSLVIAAYNCGPDKVNKAIHRAKGSADYWNIYPYLPKETRGYVPAFIAANYIMNYYCDHNICPMVTELPLKTDTVVVNKDLHLEQIAQVLNINIQHLRSLNPQYRRDIVNGLNKPMTVRLPSSLVGPFIDQEDSIYNFKTDELLLKRSVVEVNQEEPKVSRHSYHSSRHRSSATRSRSRKSRSRKSKRGGRNVTIKSGDTLSEIAERNHTTVAKLRKLNKISGNHIRAGKKLKVK